MSTAPTSLWRAVAYTLLFGLLRFVIAPLGRYVVLPILWVLALVVYAAAAFVLFLVVGETRRQPHAA